MPGGAGASDKQRENVKRKSKKWQQHNSFGLLWLLLTLNISLQFLPILFFPSWATQQYRGAERDLLLLRNGGLQQWRCRHHKNHCGLALTRHHRQKPGNSFHHKYPPGFCCDHSQPITESDSLGFSWVDNYKTGNDFHLMLTVIVSS